MKLEDQRDLDASVDDVRRGLHDPDVLRRVVPRCREVAAVGPDHFVVVLGVAAGPFDDTYRGMLTVQDTAEGLRVALDAHGRMGRLEVGLRIVLLARDGRRARVHCTADATLSGLAARAVTTSIDVVGHQLTTRAFADLESALVEADVAALV